MYLYLFNYAHCLDYSYFQTHASPLVYATFERGATCVIADCKYQYLSILFYFKLSRYV